MCSNLRVGLETAITLLLTGAVTHREGGRQGPAARGIGMPGGGWSRFKGGDVW